MSLDTDAAQEKDLARTLEEFKRLVDERKYKEARRFYEKSASDVRGEIQKRLPFYVKEANMATM